MYARLPQFGMHLERFRGGPEMPRRPFCLCKLCCFHFVLARATGVSVTSIKTTRSNNVQIVVSTMWRTKDAKEILI
jgi:hypothetical protein